MPVRVGSSPLDLDQVRSVIEGAEVVLDPDALARVHKTHLRVQSWGAERRPIYGVNTGFGEMVHVSIPPAHKTALQVNLVRGHAAAGGTLLPEPVVRATMLARLNSLMQAHSGVSTRVLEILAALLNHRICPAVPEQGSLGASGDLAPLSHIAACLIGEGEVVIDGRRAPVAPVLAELGISPIALGYKEGLALVNGTSATTGAAVVALLNAQRSVRMAVFLSSIMVQCLRGSTSAYEHNGHALKGHSGQIGVAAALRRLVAGSGLVQRHADIMEKVRATAGDTNDLVETGVYLQHAYTLRCVPQILGPVVDTLAFCATTLRTEINSVNDNPLFFGAAEETFHGGNFHAQYPAMACDYLAIAMIETGVLAERQLNRLVDPALNAPLPDFLALSESGLSMGLMGAQYLATSIASENLDLAGPSSVKSLPSNGQNQDVVSMGLNAARRCLRLDDNVRTILGVLGAACFQAMTIIGPEQFAEQANRWYSLVAADTDPYDESSPVHHFLDTVRSTMFQDECTSLVDESVQLVLEGARA